MKNHLKPALLGLLALGSAHFTTAGADVNCPPNLGAVTLDDNVAVRGPCVLDGTRVQGNVLVYAGGALLLREATVDGNVQAENALSVRVLRSSIIGDVQLDNVQGGDSKVNHSTVDGNIQLNSNLAPLAVQYNVVDGDIQAFDNSGSVAIRYNTVDGNLQCKGNHPPPTGGFNQVSGNKEDQCANLMMATQGTPGAGETNGDCAAVLRRITELIQSVPN